MLLFYVGTERYAIACSYVVEVVRLTSLRTPKQLPPNVVGMFKYSNVIVPVIDLCQLIQGTPCKTHLSTRIILVRYQVLGQESPSILGVMAERVTETIDSQDTELVDSGITVSDAPYLGKIISDHYGLIQQVKLDRLLPDICHT
ncbi:chemotaxis protein CheW [Pseudanabaena catenata USMAC16]|nr:chemotaxis protein CheW [Pseudanabaena catenata]MDG3495040.1 chemotaxis protein CheW [Pseudanabaena catenata USMAC16]